MKKFLSLALCILLLCAFFSGCGGSADSGKVVVCFDVPLGSNNNLEIEGFLRWLDTCNRNMGLSITSKDVEVQVLTYNYDDPGERSATLQKIRTDIMAGKGPDVFICSDFNTGVQGGEFGFYDHLIPNAEKARESGLFLPLDEDLPQLTLTKATDMIPQVLESGKNQKGEQVILPMTFTVPGVIYSEEPGEELPQCDFEGTSWDDVLQGDDPLLQEQVNWFLNYANISYGMEETYDGFLGAHASGLFCLFSQTADFENEELSFSEEELTAQVKDSLAAYHRAAEQDEVFPGSSKYLSTWNFWHEGGFEGKDYSFAPLRNLEGGSTAVVAQYCAVNANTNKKDKALAVIDALLCREFQTNGLLYQTFMEMPVYLDLVSPGTTYLDVWLEFTEEQYEMWRRICEDINIVRFPSPLDKELDNMMMDIEDAMLESLPADEERYPRDARLADCTISDEKLEEIISEHYRQMQRLVDES